jgi:hypothetical protein
VAVAQHATKEGTSLENLTRAGATLRPAAGARPPASAPRAPGRPRASIKDTPRPTRPEQRIARERRMVEKRQGGGRSGQRNVTPAALATARQARIKRGVKYSVRKCCMR